MIVEYFGNLGKTVWEGLSIIEQGIALPFELIGYMPSILGTSITIVVAVMVVKFILGR